MFKKRALQVKMVRTNDHNEQIAECDHLDPEKIDTMIREQVKHAAIVAVSVITIATILHTVSEIVINATKPKER